MATTSLLTPCCAAPSVSSAAAAFLAAIEESSRTRLAEFSKKVINETLKETVSDTKSSHFSPQSRLFLKSIENNELERNFEIMLISVPRPLRNSQNPHNKNNSKKRK